MNNHSSQIWCALARETNLLTNFSLLHRFREIGDQKRAARTVTGLENMPHGKKSCVI